jgi:predicted RNA-binding Zn-ribbon protein involved in translation (DUF1610 family)
MEQLSFGLLITDPQAYRIEAQRKTRRCLSCSDDFASTGPGNRICPGCKDHEIWRSNVTDYSIAAAAF